MSYQRMVLGYLNLMKANGAFEDSVFDEYTVNNFQGYLLSNDRNRWLPGRQSGRNTPRFVAIHTVEERNLLNVILHRLINMWIGLLLVVQK